MSTPQQPEEIVDYTGFDFPGLWSGRQRVSEVERSIVADALSRADRRRILEVGTGFGRLLGTLTALGHEVVATDFDAGTLERLSFRDRSDRVTRVASNLYHLPFVDGAFTAATLIRVHHHLLEPVAALTEIARVLRGGAPLVVSYQPRPSVGTMVNDLQRAVRRSRTTPFESVTFARDPVVLHAPPFPIRAAGRKQFDREARAAGFDPEIEVGAGLEEYAPLRRWKADRFVRLGIALGRAPAFPTRFAVMAKRTSPAGPLPDRFAILACPRCGFPQPSWSEGGALVCGRCPFEGIRRGPVLDLRYVPEGARRWGVVT